MRTFKIRAERYLYASFVSLLLKPFFSFLFGPKLSALDLRLLGLVRVKLYVKGHVFVS